MRSAFSGKPQTLPLFPIDIHGKPQTLSGKPQTLSKKPQTLSKKHNPMLKITGSLYQVPFIIQIRNAAKT
jgi:hypothetical protein